MHADQIHNQLSSHSFKQLLYVCSVTTSFVGTGFASVFSIVTGSVAINFEKLGFNTFTGLPNGYSGLVSGIYLTYFNIIILASIIIIL
jgi:hypothetical protein